MTFSFGLLYLLAVLFLQELPHNKTQKFLRYAAYTAMGLGIWCNVIYANQSYLKVALEEKATDALMVRVIDRLEQTEGYVPGETPIAVVGLITSSPFYKLMDLRMSVDVPQMLIQPAGTTLIISIWKMF